MAIKTCTGTTSQPFVHVQARLSQPCTITATGLDAPLVTDATGLVGGTYSISLWAASDLTPTGTYYTITEFLGSTDNTFNVQVPASAGPFVLSSILVGTPTASPSPNHVSTLIVDGTSGVAINASGDVAGRSFTASSSSSYAQWPNQPAGSIMGTVYPPAPLGGASDDTANLAAQLTAAGTAATAAGGRIDFALPLGLWNTTGLVLPASVNLKGPGTLKLLSGGSAVCVQASTDNFVSGVTFNLNGVTNAVGVEAETTSARVQIQNNDFTGVGNAVNIKGAATDISIAGNECANNGYGVLFAPTSTAARVAIVGNNCVGGSSGDAIEVNTPTGGATDITVFGNTITGYSTAGGNNAGFGVGIAHGTRVTVQGNVFSALGNQGVHIEDGSSEIVVEGNTITGAGAEGIAVISSNAARLCKNIHIANNTVDSCGGSYSGATGGISVSGSLASQNVTVRGNRVRDCGTGATTFHGIDLGGVAGANLLNHYVVADNIVTNTRGTTNGGIRVNGSQMVEIHGNVCYDDQAVQTQQYGLRVVGGSRLSVHDNDFRGNLTGAVLDTTSVDSYYRANRGYNPIGSATPPAVAATTVVLGNPFRSDATVLIAGGTLTAIGVGGLPKVGATGSLTATPSGTGGTLTNNTTYAYRVTALNAAGETAVSFLLSPTTPAGPNTCSVSISWTAIPGASGYHVYGRTGGILRIGTNIQTTTFVDDGSVTPSGATPGGDTTGNTATGITAAAAAGAAHSVRVPWGGGIAITYTVVPTWTWFLD